MEEISDRVNRLEWDAKRQDERMNQGAEAFSAIRTALEDVKEQIHSMNTSIASASLPTPIKWSWVLGFGFAVMTTLISVLWSFAQYPDREEFDSSAAQSAQRITDLQEQLGKLESAQAGTRTQSTLLLAEVWAEIEQIRPRPRKRKHR